MVETTASLPNETTEISAEIPGELNKKAITKSSQATTAQANINETGKVIKHYPKITSSYISIYEYARILSDLSQILYSKPSLSKYLGTVEVNTMIDTNRLAYELLKNNVFDAVIDRGYETVTFSCLKINPIYNSMIEDFLNEQDQNTNTAFSQLLKTNVTQ